MAIEKTQGIVLNSIKYGETSIITNIYTEKFGRQAYIIKGARSPKSKLKSNQFQPFYMLDMEVYNKPGRELQMIREAKNSRPFVSIPFEMKKSTVCLFLAEVLSKTLHEEEANPLLFQFIEDSIVFFDEQDDFPINFHLTFLLHLTRFLGFYPNDNFSESQVWFDLKEGMFFNFPPHHKYYLEREPSKDFHNLLNTGYGDKIKFSKPSMRQFLLDKLFEFFRLHQVQVGEIKSLEVLREVFH